MPTRRCFECVAGEHEDYDDDLRKTTVRDPETQKVIAVGFLCNEHREMFAEDGYSLTVR